MNKVGTYLCNVYCIYGIYLTNLKDAFNLFFVIIQCECCSGYKEFFTKYIENRFSKSNCFTDFTNNRDKKISTCFSNMKIINMVNEMLLKSHSKPFCL